jgi:hypothetical protein
VDMVRYWSSLFTHRGGGTGKGILEVNLIDTLDDDVAKVPLGSTP